MDKPLRGLISGRRFMECNCNDSVPRARVAERPSLWVVRAASQLVHSGIMQEIILVSKLPIMISYIIPGVLNSYI